MNFKGYFYACISAISYGAIPLFAIPLKQEPIPFDSVLFYRFSFTAIMIAVYLLAKKVDLRITLKELVPLMILGVTYALSSTFLFWGYDFLSAGVASTILFMYPVFVALLMGIFFREKISWITATAILISLVGVFVLNKSEEGFSVNIGGLSIVLLSALFYALYIVIVNKSVVKEMSGPKLTVYSMGFCSLFFLGKSFCQGDFQLIPSLYIGSEIVLFSLVTTVLSCITLVYAIHYIGSTPTAILGALEPVVAVCISVVLFNEPLTVNLIIGILLIIAAVMLIILSDYIIRDARRLIMSVSQKYTRNRGNKE